MASTTANYFLLLLLASVSGQLIDEMQVYEDQCLGEDRFHCLDGGCVSREQQCNGVGDCADDSDELGCLHEPHSVIMAICDESHQFLCEDGSQCISTTWMCNSVPECADGSDELNCTDVVVTGENGGNTTCRGFKCDGGHKCISTAWLCDAIFDCDDHTDEKPENCRHSHHEFDWRHCIGDRFIRSEAPYLCADKSFCFPNSMVCDGMPDCKDHSDEGDICKNWKTMCSNITCGENATCWNTQEGPKCGCIDLYSTYNYSTKTCEFADMCEDPSPFCSQICYNLRLCRCEDGYHSDPFGVHFNCYAQEPEGKLFFSTMNDIRFLTVKSKQIVTVATGIKQAHGVSYDGSYLYWVEKAKGHQSIVRAHLDNVQGTKQVLVSIGLEDAGDVAIDWMGDHIYFGDSERGSIYVCKSDGSMCKTLDNTGARHPKFVTLDPKNGMMYWADLRNHTSVIMMARMDGSHAEVLLDNLPDFPTGLAVDPPSGRLYYAAGVVVGVFIKNRRTYTVAAESIHHPYAVAVFENDVYFSDWTSHTIQRVRKTDSDPTMTIDGLSRYYKIDDMVYGMHIYHPVLMDRQSNPCKYNECSHLCLIVSNTTSRCACPDGHILSDNTTCITDPDFHPQYVVIAAGSRFTRIQVNALENAELSATTFDVGRVNALAYDGKRDTLYIYDGKLKTLNSMFMDSFQTGVTHTLLNSGFQEVVDMDFDPISESLYILDAGSRYLEVFSVFTYKKAVLKRFVDETPISLCVLYNDGKILVALRSDFDDRVEIREYDLDGEGEQVIVSNYLKGPRILMKCIETEDLVYISDDGNNIIEYMHPKGSGRETYVELSTSVTGLAVTPTYVFWTDRRNTRLYWSVLHEARPKIRRLEFSIFPNNTHLHIQSVIPSPNPVSVTKHACHKQSCSDVCVQSSSKGFKCLCAPGRVEIEGYCLNIMQCSHDQGYCPGSNMCYNISGRCDGKPDCLHNEDEERCPASTDKPSLPVITPELERCLMDQKWCYGECINRNAICKVPTAEPETKSFKCDEFTEFECFPFNMCISRSQLCDGIHDCPDKSDEADGLCAGHTCFSSEFRCKNGICIYDSFRCDGEPDCADGSDEVGCTTIKCAPGYFTCKSGNCIPGRNRCDGIEDCADESDELDCEDSDDYGGNQETAENCKEWEYTCELNHTICIPQSARCNKKADCPGGTDEAGCSLNQFNNCAWFCDWRCLEKSKVCDGYKHCPDGSDEFTDACSRVNRTSIFLPTLTATHECYDGYMCKNGQCVEWQHVCDSHIDCYDESDEGGNCSTSCENQCAQKCLPSPRGPVCQCEKGLKPKGNLCVDINECQEMDVCAHGCLNVHGSYLCRCDRGYVLRPDRHSCKAVKGHLSLIFVSGKQVMTKVLGHVSVAYSADETVQGIDLNIRNNTIYVSTENKLIEVKASKSETVVTNIGNPTKVSFDWSTGNLYYVDQSDGMPNIRVCNLRRKRCAKLLRLATNSTVPALAIDPSSHRLFYCVITATDSVVWMALLSGQSAVDLASVNYCSGLTVDSYRKKLYVAESQPPRILQMDYDGNMRKEMHSNDPHLKSPYGLSIFEDHIYYLVRESDQIRRCLLFGSKKCEVYQLKALQAQEFALHHDNLQRHDILDKCAKFVCDNICVNSDAGPVCICEDGAVTRNGSCALIEKIFLPQFNGEIHQPEYTNSHADVALACLLAMLALLLVMVVTYSVVKKRDRYSGKLTRVQFSWRHERGSACDLTEEGTRIPSAPTAHPEAEPLVPNNSMTDVSRHEYLNPMEGLSFIQNLRKSFTKQRRPIGTAGLMITIPRGDDSLEIRAASDTESDLDDRDSRPFSCFVDRDKKRTSSPC